MVPRCSRTVNVPHATGLVLQRTQRSIERGDRARRKPIHDTGGR